MEVDKKLNIVIWAFPSWHGNYMKSTVELAKELSLHHRVLYIDYAYTIKDVLTAKSDSNMPIKRIMKGDQCIKNVTLNNGGNITLLSLPPIVPFNWTDSKAVYKIIEGINTRIVSSRVKRILKKLQFETDIVLNAFNPFFASAVSGIFQGIPVVYYCYDNINASTWASKHGGWLEKEFSNKIKAAIFSSEALLNNKGWEVPGYVVKNGVDLRIFNNVTDGRLKSLPHGNEKKIIGYVGTVDDRLDFNLLEKLAFDNPQFEFHFIGRVITLKSDRLKALPNVTFFGPVDPQMLPGMMQHFDAAVIPFVKNDFTRNVYPMKVNEYLAMGIPVVSTGFAKFNDLAGYMEIADDAATFATNLNEVIAGNDDNKRQSRKAKANTNSWEQKSLEFENILMRYAG